MVKSRLHPLPEKCAACSLSIYEFAAPLSFLVDGQNYFTHTDCLQNHIKSGGTRLKNILLVEKLIDA